MTLSAFVDFETRSEADLRKVGQSVYARHKSTEVLCLAAKITGGQELLWLPGQPMPEELREVVERGGELHAHNAAFERVIWQHVMVVTHKWPKVRHNQWHCTAAKAASFALPRSLDQVAKALGLAEQKDAEGHRVMMKLCKPRKPSKHNPSTWHEDPEDFARLYSYCKQDVKTELAVDGALPEFGLRNRFVWLLNERINDRGIPMDREFITNAIEVDKDYTANLTAELKELTGGEVTSARQQAKMVQWLNKQGVNVEDVKKETVAKALEDSTLSSSARRGLQLRQLLSKSSTAKYEAMLRRLDEDDRIRGEHLFHGAATGRFAGSGVQFQNLPRPASAFKDFEKLLGGIEAAKQHDSWLIGALLGQPATFLASAIRSAVKAKDGRRLIVCDFAGIEARVLGWMAAEKRYQKAFAAKDDLYVDMAGALYGEAAAQANRQMGKIAILGLGYGMGKDRFVEAARLMGGIDVDADEAQEVVQTYRQRYASIVRWWYSLSDASIQCVETGEPQVVTKVRFTLEDDFLFVQLPSGRKLAYNQPTVREEDTPVGRKPQLSYMGVNSITKKWERKRTYGGKLCENIVQAVALDLLADAMFRLEKAGYPIVLHVHDEVVCEVPNGFGSVAEVEQIMCASDRWAEGCIVDAEGFESERYRK